MHGMTRHVGHGTSAEIPPAAPNPRMISRIIRTKGRGTDPHVPIEAHKAPTEYRRAGLPRLDRWDGESRRALPGRCPITPDSNISAVLKASSLAQLCTLICVATLASRAAAATARASCMVWVNGFAQYTGFPRFKALHRDHGVIVIGCGDNHRIDVLFFLVEHLPEIAVHARFGYFRNTGAAKLWSISHRISIRSLLQPLM